MSRPAYDRFTSPVALLWSLALLTACAGNTAPPPVAVASTADSGPGSLRDLLKAAKTGDTLKLPNGTVNLASALQVTQSITLDLGSAVLDAGGKNRALEVPSGITVTLKGGTLKGGVGAPISAQKVGPQATSLATYGGVILNQGTLTLDGTTVSGGKANLGGGVANLGDASLTLKGDAKITGNMAEALPDNAADDSGGGGGIYNAGTLKVEAGAVSNNISRYLGGGIYAPKSGSTTISGGHIDANTCTYPLTSVSGGTAGCVGGGIYTEGPLTLSGGTVRMNTATLSGGGLEVIGTGTVFTMSGGEISGHTTWNAGGGVLLGSGTIMNFSGGSILNNKATDTANSGGGGILAYRSTLKMSGGTVKGNSAKYGGGIDAFTDNTVEISGGTIEDNRTIRSGNGGGINVNTRSTLKFTGGTIQNNIAEGGGGGIAVSDEAGLLTLSNTATVKGNTAKDGGGVAVYGAKLTISGGSIQDNQASRTGGGLVDGGSVEMTGGVISGNTSGGTTDGGGGVRVYREGKLTLAGGAINGNISSRTGGGITSDGEIIMTGGEIKNNVVTRAEGHQGGGGVRLYSAGKMTASGGTISENKAPYGAGAEITGPYETSPTAEFILSGASVIGNVVTDQTNNGGGFFNEGKLTITSGNVTGNTATQRGGGVYNKKSAGYTQPGGNVTGNTPDNVFTESN